MENKMSKGSGTVGDPGRTGVQMNRDDNIDSKPWSELRHEATDKFKEGESDDDDVQGR